MNNVWTFSASSQPYYKRCLEVASQINEENKWCKKFKKKLEKDETVLNSNENQQENVEARTVVDLESEKDNVDKDLDIGTHDEIFENIDLDFDLKIEYLIEKCIEEPKLTSKLPEKLSSNSIERLCDYVFSEKLAECTFLGHFYENFFPAFIKKRYSRLCLDLLVKADIAYPLLFSKLFNLILKDIEIDCKVVQDFYNLLNENSKITFIERFLNLELNAEEFSRHLFTLQTAYKSCKKNDRIQAYVEKMILDNHEISKTDKTFGKLLLTFLQEQKVIGFNNNREKLQKIVDLHLSPFKKPCRNVLC